MIENTLSLTEYGIVRPEKVAWRFPTQVADPLEGISSKSLRSFLRRTDEILTKNDIEVIFETLDTSAFENWLGYYKTKMTENKYQVLASPEWYQNRIAKGVIVEGLFLTQRGNLVGSAIITRQNLEKGTLAFKASDRMNLSSQENSSIGAVIDYLFLQKMFEKQVQIISAGKSRNAFGIHNTFGYLDYKLRFGFRPHILYDATLLSEVPLNDRGQVLFFAEKSDQLHLFAFKPQNDPTKFEAARFNSDTLPFTQIEYSA